MSDLSQPLFIIGELGVDHELLTPYISIIGQFASIDTVNLRSLRPDIVIFSVDLEVLNGVNLVRRLPQEFQNTKFLIVTDSYHATKYHNQLMRAGAHGFCLRSSGVATLIEAIQSALQGHSYCDPRITQLVKQSPMTSMPNCNLTDREIEVLKLLDFSNKVIAERLDMKLRNVEKNIECILAKLNVPTRTAAFLKAVALGLRVLPNDEEDVDKV